MALDNKLIDQMPADYKKPEDIIGERGLQKQLTRAILEPALAAEMTDHLRYEKHDPVGQPTKATATVAFIPTAAGARSALNWTR